ncbi:CvpA family protein [Thermosediminibacter litoriperuensis]|uniref:Putative membrane protein required for colicin V production n=1 Tax=Thermosediminibacter litoriperuensis TaxID=291989 RepID=A0A5S5AVQ7_9FIRM|nr:CvpA family protein [Thermosediminibacter litoriperuensis]TYP57425.1 putative membrane protein required for colicin V production [Thermosediminibacter litoriperuensis]
MNWLDILLIVLFLKSAFEGFSRGFLLSAFKIAGVLTALYVSVFYRDAAVGFMKGSLKMEEALSPVLNLTKLPGTAQAVEAGATGINALLEMALSALAFLIIFLAVQALFALVGFFLSGVFRFSQLSFLNRIMGLSFGLLSTSIWIALVSSVLTPFVMAWPGSVLERGVSGSYILQHMKFLDFILPVVVKLI